MNLKSFHAQIKIKLLYFNILCMQFNFMYLFIKNSIQKEIDREKESSDENRDEVREK